LSRRTTGSCDGRRTWRACQPVGSAARCRSETVACTVSHDSRGCITGHFEAIATWAQWGWPPNRGTGSRTHPPGHHPPRLTCSPVAAATGSRALASRARAGPARREPAVRPDPCPVRQPRGVVIEEQAGDQLAARPHVRGVAAVTGLYFLGLLWQHSQASASLLGPELDGPYLLEMMGREAAGSSRSAADRKLTRVA
jgi:hypothetical protein